MRRYDIGDTFKKGGKKMAGDAVSVAPNLYKVLAENDKVRVLETRYGPGVKSDMHSHPDLVACLDPSKGNLHLGRRSHSRH